MPILTYIDDIPLFTNKSEAIAWGATSSPRLVGYHTHEHEGQIGYMAGRFHKANLNLKQRSNYQNYIREANQANIILSNKINSLEQEKQELIEVLKIKKFNKARSLDNVARGKINNIDRSLVELNSQREKVQLDKKTAQKSNPNRFELLLNSNKIETNYLQKATAAVKVVEDNSKDSSNLVLNKTRLQQEIQKVIREEETVKRIYRSNY
tara:strand:- start:291 stop:917 length:627 start_codon:yes stop_codon:yes gene_type:complete